MIKKLNWGSGIALFYIFFVLILISFVIFTFFNKVDLVEDNYYKKELVYQKHIEKIDRTSKLTDQLKIISDNEYIELLFPVNIVSSKIGGTINFYRPSNRKLDFSVAVSPDLSGRQIVETKKIAKGLWKVKVNWKSDSLDYYNEQVIIIK